MDNQSKPLYGALFVMIIIFSVVVILKGDFKKRAPYIERKISSVEKRNRKPAEVASRAEERTSPTYRFPALEIEKKKPDVQKAAAVIDRREPYSITVPIDKDDANREVIANEILLIMDPAISIVMIEALQQKYDISLQYYDSATGVAYFTIPKESPFSRRELEHLLPQQNSFIKSAEPNAIMDFSALPAEIEKNALWYLKNDARVSFNGRLAIRRGSSILSWPTPTTTNVDIGWGQWNDTTHLWNSGLSCSQLNGNPLIAVVDSGGDPIQTELKDRIDFSHSANVGCSNNVNDTSISSYFDFEAHKGCYQNPTELEQLYTDIKNLPENNRKITEIHMAHGMLVSSVIISALNGTGALGVCPEGKIAHIMMGRLGKKVDSQGNVTEIGHIKTTIDGYLGIRKAIDFSGAKIINASWSVGEPAQACEGKYRVDCTLLQAIRYARKNGALIIAAAGNNGVNIDDQRVGPASMASEWANSNNEFAHLISVGGFNPSGGRWSSSCFGPTAVTLAAPSELMGVTKFSAEYANTNAAKYGDLEDLDPRKGEEIYWASGTSGATPVVSSIAAILYRILHNKFGDSKDISGKLIFDYAKTIATILRDTARRGGLCQVTSQETEKGCLDAFAAIVEAKRLVNNIGFQLASLDISTLPGGDLTTASAGGSPGPTGDTSSGTTAVSSGASSGSGGGGGCGFIDTGSSNSGNSGNWPLVCVYGLSILYVLHRRLKLLALVRHRKKRLH